MTIVERAQRTVEANEERLDILFGEHAEAVYAYVLRRIKLSSAAEDITSEVFSEALRQPGRIPRGDERPWLFGIARRKVADHFRRQKVRREVPLEREVFSLEASPAGQLIEIEGLKHLRALIERLPTDQREALLLHYVEGLNVKQIAITMRRSRFAVNSLLQRARRRILEQGKDYFTNEGSQR